MIIDKMIYKDVSNIIKGYLFSKCSLCNQDEYPEKLDRGVIDKQYCKTCQEHSSIVKRCCRCNYFYEIKNNIYYCKSCSGLCELYCNDCFGVTQSVFYGLHYIDGPHYYAFWEEMNIPNDIIDIDLIISILE